MARQKVWAGAAVAVAMAAGAIGGAVIGVPSLSGAQSNSPTTTVPGHHAFGPHGGMPGAKQDLLAAAAKALNLTTDQLLQKLSDGTTTIADVAKQQNVDINTVIDAMVGADRDAITNMVNNPLPRFKGGPDGGIGGSFGPMGPGRFGHFGGANADAVAKALGISTEQLMQDLRNGQTIKQIAQSKNVDLNTLITTLVNDASAKIDQAVKNGKLTKAQGETLKSNLQARITDLVDNGIKFRPHIGGMGGMGGRGFGGPMMGGNPPA